MRKEKLRIENYLSLKAVGVYGAKSDIDGKRVLLCIIT